MRHVDLGNCELKDVRRVQDEFQETCKDKEFCDMPIYDDMLPAECQDPSHEFFFVTGCFGDDIEIPFIKEFFNAKVSREMLAYIVIGSDLLICLSFAVGIYVLGACIKQEKRTVNEKFVQITDFTVVIKQLPPKSEWGNLERLRALLYNHLCNVVDR